jgi:large subunit ribosomal protein L25
MSETVVVNTEPRDGRGSKKAYHLRKAGRVPAVVYGHGEATVSVSVGHDDFAKVLKTGAKIVDLKTNGTTQSAQIVDIQYDHLGNEVLHVDFKRVSKDETIKLAVPVELRGTVQGAGAGLVVDQPLHVLHVECLVTAVPERIRVTIDGLGMGQAIHVRELKLPEGVKVLEDADAIVVQVKAAHDESVTTAAVAEPEVIGRKAEAEAEEEAK